MKKSVYEIVTGEIVALLESGTAPWRKPWSTAASLPPLNYASKRPYTGINFFLLSAKFDDPYFLTLKQANQLGGKVRKGEKSTIVIFWRWKFFDADGKPVQDEKQAVKKVPFPRYYRVFNATQVEGIEFDCPERAELRPNEKIGRCEEVVAGCEGLRLEHREGRACYSPALDLVHMPPIQHFVSGPDYYATLFHELGHWTGHRSRLDRFAKDDLPAAFGSESYSREELVAEMASCFLCHQCQIDLPELKQNAAAYLAHWVRALRGDAKLVVSAASRAERAARFILG